MVSIDRPSRRVRASATITRYCGLRILPSRVSLILTAMWASHFLFQVTWRFSDTRAVCGARFRLAGDRRAARTRALKRGSTGDGVQRTSLDTRTARAPIDRQHERASTLGELQVVEVDALQPGRELVQAGRHLGQVRHPGGHPRHAQAYRPASFPGSGRGGTTPSCPSCPCACSCVRRPASPSPGHRLSSCAPRRASTSWLTSVTVTPEPMAMRGAGSR